MKLCVKKCCESWKYTDMYIISYDVVKIDVVSNTETTVEKHVLSALELESGKTYSCSFTKNGNYSWISAAEETKEVA